MSRKHVSPGVYTFETELRATYQNLGVTSAALVGETLKGAAFQPMKVTSYTEFVAKFGKQFPTLLTDSSGNYKFPKYEVSYMAKAYLEKANSLYVTRVLGLSGYNAGKAYGIYVDSKLFGIIRIKKTFSNTELGGRSGVITLANVTELTTVNNSVRIDYTVDGIENSVLVSFDPTAENYITKIFGYTNTVSQYPFYIESFAENALEYYKTKNNVTSGVTISEVPNAEDFKFPYQASETPWFIDVVGQNVIPLFKLVTISDGETSINEVKVSIADLNEDTKTFTVLIRDFNDTDNNPIVKERFTRCSLDVNSKDFIGRKIGTIDGDYIVRSNYVMVEMNEDIDNASKYVPKGFLGIPTLNLEGFDVLDLKASYNYNDNKKKTYLGFSTNNKYDFDLFKALPKSDELGLSNGFIISNAEISNPKYNGADVDLSNFIVTAENVLGNQKFTTYFYGGFDGWDINKPFRTNEDKHTYNSYINQTTGVFDTAKANNEGVKRYTVSNGENGLDTDYYAYLEGVRTFANPEEIDINVIAVGGLDYKKNASLLSEIIEIVEDERADSIFIMNSPNVKSEGEAVEWLMDSGIVSSYTATFYPWKQYNDTDNQVYINIPATMDVLRNIAMVDRKRVPWYAVAGLDRGNVVCVKALKKLTNAQRDVLYEGKINPIQTWAKEGVKIWGNKTLHEDSDAALSSLNVRRLILEARKLIAVASLKLVFDQNDMQIRSQFLTLVNPILENIRRERGLTEFRVEVDESVESIQRKELNARILIKPTPALEFITIEFGVTDQGVSFDDV